MIISIVTAKGGSGKTTSAVNLAGALKEAKPSIKLRVIDLDNSATSLLEYADALSGVDFSRVEMAALRNALTAGAYDVTILDAPPRPEPREVGGLCVLSDHIIVPAPTFSHEVENARAMVDIVRGWHKQRGTRRPRLHMLITKHKRHATAQGLKAELERDFPRLLCAAVVPHHDAFDEAAYRKQTVLSIAPRTAGARAYRQLAQEVLGWL